MWTIVFFLLVAMATPPHVLAQMPTAPEECYTQESVIKGAPFPILYRIEGEDLRTFNENYTRLFDKEAPDNDLVMIFGEPSDEMVYLVSFTKGCMDHRPAPILMETVNKLRFGQPA